MIRFELFFGLVVFALWVFSLVDVIGSDEGAIRHLPKLWWLLIVLFFPFAGSVAWLVAGRPAAPPRARGTSGQCRRIPSTTGPVAPPRRARTTTRSSCAGSATAPRSSAAPTARNACAEREERGEAGPPPVASRHACGADRWGRVGQEHGLGDARGAGSGGHRRRRAAREVVERGTPGLAAVVEEFGEELLGPDGELDRPAMGRLVFGDEEARRRLEEIVHPLVFERIVELEEEAPPGGVVVHDIPLLAENGRAGTSTP